ncbi:hypothetical protein [Methylomicrobium sp. Wu6]|uniref:hypothetical protein n=1 Tax=Methylomicrobium sp. Wu6 TaxID=3107928 RepID=UPI002DD62B90|nr:hypothetical protein [Methylomicrobium sp. Wu6]MEC4748671.1 hypothetical protein [Methylomicrobium sp. Wu6]
MELSECDALVDPAKSRRLREMVNGKHADAQAQRSIAAFEPENRFDLPVESWLELQQARRIIDDEIARITSFFPEGRKNSLFKIRFGTLEEIRTMEIQAIFKRLKFDDKRVNLSRLRKINYHGEKIS